MRVVCKQISYIPSAEPPPPLPSSLSTPSGPPHTQQFFVFVVILHLGLHKVLSSSSVSISFIRAHWYWILPPTRQFPRSFREQKKLLAIMSSLLCFNGRSPPLSPPELNLLWSRALVCRVPHHEQRERPQVSMCNAHTMHTTLSRDSVRTWFTQLQQLKLAVRWRFRCFLQLSNTALSFVDEVVLIFKFCRTFHKHEVCLYI